MITAPSNKHLCLPFIVCNMRQGGSHYSLIRSSAHPNKAELDNEPLHTDMQRQSCTTESLCLNVLIHVKLNRMYARRAFHTGTQIHMWNAAGNAMRSSVERIRRSMRYGGQTNICSKPLCVTSDKPEGAIVVGILKINKECLNMWNATGCGYAMRSSVERIEKATCV